MKVKHSHNKTAIEYNFGRQKDLSTLNRYSHLPCGLSEYQCFGSINPHVILIEVNNCIMSTKNTVNKCLLYDTVISTVNEIFETIFVHVLLIHVQPKNFLTSIRQLFLKYLT